MYLFVNGYERPVLIGDFYGDPEAGIIDDKERFCVIVGCGGIIYYLCNPYEEYSYDYDSGQWVEFGRDPENIKWFTGVRQIDGDIIDLDLEGGETVRVRVPL